jgi:uncharacterized membrane protein
MSQFVVVTFRNAAMNQQGVETIKMLRAERRVEIYESSMVSKDEGGKLSVQQITGQGLGLPSVGALIGGLAALPLGSAAVILAAVGGALVGASARLIYEADKAAFVHETARALLPGKAVIAAEIGKDDLAAFTTEMERMGGTVARR